MAYFSSLISPQNSAQMSAPMILLVRRVSRTQLDSHDVAFWANLIETNKIKIEINTHLAKCLYLVWGSCNVIKEEKAKVSPDIQSSLQPHRNQDGW